MNCINFVSIAAWLIVLHFYTAMTFDDDFMVSKRFTNLVLIVFSFTYSHKSRTTIASKKEEKEAKKQEFWKKT